MYVHVHMLLAFMGLARLKLGLRLNALLCACVRGHGSNVQVISLLSLLARLLFWPLVAAGPLVWFKVV
jgi:hypothetical protein